MYIVSISVLSTALGAAAVELAEGPARVRLMTSRLLRFIDAWRHSPIVGTAVWLYPDCAVAPISERGDADLPMDQGGPEYQPALKTRRSTRRQATRRPGLFAVL